MHCACLLCIFLSVNAHSVQLMYQSTQPAAQAVLTAGACEQQTSVSFCELESYIVLALTLCNDAGAGSEGVPVACLPHRRALWLLLEQPWPLGLPSWSRGGAEAPHLRHCVLMNELALHHQGSVGCRGAVCCLSISKPWREPPSSHVLSSRMFPSSPMQPVRAFLAA